MMSRIVMVVVYSWRLEELQERDISKSKEVLLRSSQIRLTGARWCVIMPKGSMSEGFFSL